MTLLSRAVNCKELWIAWIEQIESGLGQVATFVIAWPVVLGHRWRVPLLLGLQRKLG